MRRLGVYRSDDDGLTWVCAAPGWGGDDREGGVERVTVGADGVAYAATEFGSVLKSIDGGVTWSRLTAPTLPARTWSPTLLPLAFGTHGELLVSGNESGRFVLRAQQPDGSFAPYDFGLDVPLTAIAHAGDEVSYAATARGIFTRRDP